MKSSVDVVVDCVDSRVDLLEQLVQQEYKQLKAIVTFLLTLSKEVDKFAKSYMKAVQVLKGSVCVTNGWGNYLQGMVEGHAEMAKVLEAVSYTHLTLPTICSV
eukprot:TRINITY_DN13657_c0_g2_i2.p2 TRINITY_DN13657_c0_g2~~TRINITY_DN13657_c0_g2_i2.p2  ORF type:complete len:103 (+),score=22.90 TRINITY_DN13657_c0_g2_i2:591-899(+)